MTKIDLAGISYEGSAFRGNLDKSLLILADSFTNLGVSVKVSYSIKQQDLHEITSSTTNADVETIHLYKKMLESFFCTPTTFDIKGHFVRRSKIRKELANIKDYLSSRPNLYKEIVLTDKHLKLLSSFLEGDGDFLIILEDDAQAQSAVIHELIGDLLDLSLKNVEQFCYIDLCQHYLPSDLTSYFGISDYIDSGNYYVGEFFANTTASYLINRKTASYILSQILVSPNLRRISIDWLYTHLIRKSHNRQSFRYYLVKESFFNNGSLSTLEENRKAIS